MEEKEILAAELSKAEKARKLFDLGYSLKQVADLVCGGNYGWAYNIQKAYLQTKAVIGKGSNPEPVKSNVSEENRKTTIGKPKASIPPKPGQRKVQTVKKVGKSKQIKRKGASR